MNLIKLREFESHDFAAVQGLWELTGLGNEKRGDNARVIERSLDQGGKFWILEDLSCDELVGTCWVTNDSRRLYLHHLGVHPSYQQKGFGKLLTQKALDYAKKLDMQIKLEVHQNNRFASKLYDGLGFEDLNGYKVMIKRKH